MARDMVSIRVKLEGVDNLVRQLRKVTDKATTKSKLMDALAEGAEPIFRAADAKVPVRTGRLRESIAIREVDDLREGAGVAVVAGSPIAHLQEFGTVHHGATPFLRPAFDEQRRRALEIIRRALEREIEGATS